MALTAFSSSSLLLGACLMTGLFHPNLIRSPPPGLQVIPLTTESLSKTATSRRETFLFPKLGFKGLKKRGGGDRGWSYSKQDRCLKVTCFSCVLNSGPSRKGLHGEV